MSTWCFKKLEATHKNQEITRINPLFYILSGESGGLAPMGGITSRMMVGGAQAAAAPWTGTGQGGTPTS